MANYTSAFPSGEYPQSPPPPYSVIANQPAHMPRPVPSHYQQPLCNQDNRRTTIRSFNADSPSSSSIVNASNARAPARPLRTPPLPGSSTQARLTGNVNPNEGAMTRSLNQSAALCDRVASQLNDLLCRLEGDDSQSPEDLMRELDLNDDNVEDGRRELRDVPANRTDRPRGEAGGRVISFKKTWMYANSRLPPQMLPLKVYVSIQLGNCKKWTSC